MPVPDAAEKRPASGNVLLAGALLAGISGVILQYFMSLRVTEAYMDEEFHVRQTSLYCGNNFSYWDPKITTPPGLYLAALGYAQIQAAVTSTSVVAACSMVAMRQVNIAFHILGAVLVALLLKELHPTISNTQLLLRVLLVWCLFPFHLLYTALFYTDPGSTALVLLTYLLSIKRYTVASAASGLCSLLFRQNNIIWILFIAVLESASLLERSGHWRGRVFDSTNLSFVDEIRTLFIDYVCVAFKNLPFLIAAFWGQLALIMGFVAFVVLNNGSLVLGDPSNHQSSFHVPQVFYFSVAAVGLLDPLCVFRTSFWRRTTQAVVEAKARTLLGIILVLVLIHRLSYVHPFLLADNRHYTFYAVRIIFLRKWWIKFCLAPVYLLCMYALYSSVKQTSGLHVKKTDGAAMPPQTHKFLIRPLLACAVLAVLIPTPLIEVRYFVLPFIMVALHIDIHQPACSTAALLFSCALSFGVNVLTIGVFLFRPFVAVDGSVGRWMW